MVKRTAVHRKLFKRCRPGTSVLPPAPHATPLTDPSAVQLFSSWSPIIRRRDASRWATEHGDSLRGLHVVSPGRSKGWSTGSQHIFSDGTSVSLLFDLWMCHSYTVLLSVLKGVCAPSFLLISFSLLYYSLQSHMVRGLHHLLPKESFIVNSSIPLSCLIWRVIYGGIKYLFFYSVVV